MNKPIYDKEIVLKIGDIFLVRTINQNSIFNWLYRSQKDTQENMKRQIVGWIDDKFGKVQGMLIGQIFNSRQMQKIFVKIFEKITHQEYIQQMMYVGQGWVLYVEKTGSHLIKLSPNIIQEFDIFRCPEEYDEDEMFKLVKKYWNLEYDKEGFWLSQIGMIMNTMKIPPQQVEDLFKYDTPEKLTSQEMIVRMYKDVGIKIFDDLDNVEYVTPQDIQNRFKRLI